MGIHLETDTDSLNSDRIKMEEELGAIQRELNALQSDVRQMNRYWDGPGADAYRLRAEEDLENALSVTGYLKDYIGCMQQAANAYTDCETACEEIVDRIRI